jgi:hypothetical protein
VSPPVREEIVHRRLQSNACARPLNFTVRSRTMRVRLYTLSALLGVFVYACTNSVPPIAQGLSIPPGPTPEFTTRLRERFPAGSSVQALLDELRAERFTISGDPHRSTATYEITGFPCRDTWTIEWVAENQKISSITGEALAICL